VPPRERGPSLPDARDAVHRPSEDGADRAVDVGALDGSEADHAAEDAAGEVGSGERGGQQRVWGVARDEEQRGRLLCEEGGGGGSSVGRISV
jgi:hypothetical protein